MIKIISLIVGNLETNCYLLISGHQSLIIDPGAEPDKILKQIKISKTKLKYIINTHYHLDHLSANQAIKAVYPVKILIHQEEVDFINFSVDKFLQDGSLIKIGDIELKVIHTPGHSQGSICLLGKDFLFSGDTLFQYGYGRTDLNGGSNQELFQSLNKIKTILKPGFRVYPGHGPSWVVN